MDAVVLHSDIARLVLGYLKRQNLDRTSRLFCKTSPHLKQELSAYKKGFTPHSFCPDLEDIICEYVNITRTVDRILQSLPKNLRLQLFEHKLCEKVKFLLERALASYLKSDQNEIDAVRKEDNNQTTTLGTSLNSDKENTAKKQNTQKRRRSSLQYSSDDRKSPGPLRNKSVKRRRVLEPFCYLSSKHVCSQRRHTTLNTSSTGDEQTQTDDEDEEDSANEEENEVDLEGNSHFDDTNLMLMEKPTKESTPRNKSEKGKLFGPSLPEISQAILDNPQFQMKLVDNINQALSTSTSKDTQVVSSKNQKTFKNTNTFEATNALSEEQQIINSNEMLDQMVKDILKATEKDPAFDAIIENVVGASIQTSNISAGVQCNINSVPSVPIINMPPATVMAGQQQPQFTLLQQPQQQHPTYLPSLSAVSQAAEIALPSNVPRTPLIIRTAVAAGSSSSLAGETQMLSSITNNSFGSLIDPNFSISKLIVLNPNESAQKQPPSSDQSISNSTADNIITQLTGTEGSTDEQVYFDANTGQLTIPLFLTDEGLLANFPFLINNEAVTQQLQPDNICNLDGSHIEIPLPEPIIVSADQLPPNSIIVTSAQKPILADEQRLPAAPQPCTDCKKPKNVPLPSSLNLRSNSDRETPSTSGIVNTKAFKSLSTPRKRTSHVRTLSFSPKAEGSQQTNLAGTTPLSTRRFIAQRETDVVPETTEASKEFNNVADIPVKPIIKNVEILPRLEGTSAVSNTTIDVSANESSNSCSIPPLFVNEESSNQTVIRTELSLRESKDISLLDKENKTTKKKSDPKCVSGMGDHPDTPKRKQVRRTAVRACKRQISKSSDEGEKNPLTEMENEKYDTKDITPGEEQSKKESNEKKSHDDKMMEEWLRLRNASTSDLDSRLRHINAANTASIPKSIRRRKDKLVGRRKLRLKRAVTSKRSAKTVSDDHEVENESDNNENNDNSKVRREHETKHIEKTPKAKSGQAKKRSSKDRPREFNIKIPTPQKDKRESSMKLKNERSSVVSSDTEKKTNNDAVNDENTTFQIPSNTIVKIPEERLEHERDRRTANIACLLETPFKAPTAMDEIPPTPGLSASLLDTPATKLGTASGEIHSTSYLFGSLTKSELDTPLLSAITPGLRFTPFGSSSDVTPRSVAPLTDYSSGGSYYKPDESDDIDRHFEKVLRDSAQKRKQEEEDRVKKQEQHARENEMKETTCHVEEKQDSICVEISAEKLRVEPIVLKRVKSFSTEGTENVESCTTTLNVNPHYTLVSELPEICAAEESSNSSNTFSSSSSSTSDSSSSSSSSSGHSEVPSPKGAATSSMDKLHKTPDKLHLSLENLSSISSTEDEDWQKLAVTEEENSQLVSNDGEVRYPVRSWLTPNKANKQSLPEAHESVLTTTIKVTVPLKSAEKRNRLDDDLQQKRDRIIEKLKKDSNQRKEKHSGIPSTPPSGISAALSATRKIANMREKGKSELSKLRTQPSAKTTTMSKSTESAIKKEEKRTTEVLTALQLSAKKPTHKQSINASGSKTKSPSNLAPSLGNFDDNAVSTLFSNPVTCELTENMERLPIRTLISKVKSTQRKCLQIDPLPVLKTSRSTSVGRKKIVRNPLGFKRPIKPDSVEDLREVALPSKLLTTVVEYVEKEVEHEKLVPKVSPVPRFKIKTPTGSTAATSTKLRVSPRLQPSKEAEAKVDEDVVPLVPKQQIKKTKITKAVKTSAAVSKKVITRGMKISPARTKTIKNKKAGKNVQKETNKQKLAVKVGTGKIQRKVDINSVNEEKELNEIKKENITLMTSPRMETLVITEEARNERKFETTDSVKEDKSSIKSSISEDNKCKIIDSMAEANEITSLPTHSKTNENDENCSQVNKSSEQNESHIENKIFENSKVENASNGVDSYTTVEHVEPTSGEASEDDPLEGCELTNVAEEDPLRFITVSYNGPDVPPANPPPRRDFSNFKMVVAFDESEKHIWRISDELVLFNTLPSTQQIRNIPKKRRVRIDTCASDEENISTVGVLPSTTTEETITALPSSSIQTRVAAFSNTNNISSNYTSSSTVKPVATSTPTATAACSSIQQSQKQRSMSKAAVARTSSQTPKQPVGTTEVLQMDEIESLLSHLHGTEK